MQIVANHSLLYLCHHTHAFAPQNCTLCFPKRALYPLTRPVYSLKRTLHSLKRVLHSHKRVLHSFKRALQSPKRALYLPAEPCTLSIEPSCNLLIEPYTLSKVPYFPRFVCKRDPTLEPNDAQKKARLPQKPMQNQDLVV